jgi:hypothetical protein
MKAGTKFWACVLGLLILFVTALAGKFSGELASAVVALVGIFAGANSFNTAKALQSGKVVEP